MREPENDKGRMPLVKSIAFFTLVAFISTQAFIPSPVSFAHTPDPVVQVANADFTIPSELGKIEEVYSFPDDGGRMAEGDKPGFTSSSILHPISGRKTIVFLQDAHDSLEAQENIAKIIDWLVKEKGIKTVFEEGYEGAVPTDQFFGFIKDPVVKQKVSYFLLDKLRIGGAEYAHINRKSEGGGRMEEGAKTGLTPSAIRRPSSDFQLIGVDDLKLYSENIGAYQRASANRQETEEDLRELLGQITTLANQYFPQEFKTWLKAKERFGERKLPLLDYLRELQSLKLKTSNVSKGTVPLKSLGGLSPSYAADSFSAQYPATSLLLVAEASKEKKLIEQLNALDSKVVFGEMVRLEKDISGAFLKTDRDRQIFAYYQGLDLLRRLNRIEVTQDEYEALLAYSEERRADRKNGNSKTLHAPRSTLNADLQRLALRAQSSALFNTQGMADFIVSLTRRSLVLSKSWEQHLQDAVRFYDIARSRDRSLAKALNNYLLGDTTHEPSATKKEEGGAWTVERGADMAILVYGGFHSNAIKEILKDQGISYVVISPRITAVDQKHQDYYKQLMSVGHHSFEMPFLVSRANKPPGIFYSAVASGEATAVRSELRAITSSVEALGDHAGSQLIERHLGLALVPSGQRSTGVPGARAEVREVELAGRQGEKLVLDGFEHYFEEAWETSAFVQANKTKIPERVSKGKFDLALDPASQGKPNAQGLKPNRPVDLNRFYFRKIQKFLDERGILARLQTLTRKYFLVAPQELTVPFHTLMIADDESVRPNILTSEDLEVTLALADKNPGMKFLQNTEWYTAEQLHIHVTTEELPFERFLPFARVIGEDDSVSLLQSSEWPLSHIIFQDSDLKKLAGSAMKLIRDLQTEQIPHWTVVLKGKVVVFMGKPNTPIVEVGTILGENHTVHVLEAAGIVTVMPERKDLTETQIDQAFRAASLDPAAVNNLLLDAGFVIRSEMRNEGREHELPTVSLEQFLASNFKGPVIIGGTGMIGAHLIEKLAREGRQVAVPIRAGISAEHAKNLLGIVAALGKDGLAKRVTFVDVGDSLDPMMMDPSGASYKLLKRLLGKATVVYHLAAQTHVRPNKARGETYESFAVRTYVLNVFYTKLIARVAKALGLPMVYSSSQEVFSLNQLFQKPMPTPVTEKTPIPFHPVTQAFMSEVQKAFDAYVAQYVAGAAQMSPLQFTKDLLNKPLVQRLDEGDKWESLIEAVNLLDEQYYPAKAEEGNKPATQQPKVTQALKTIGERFPLDLLFGNYAISKLLAEVDVLGLAQAWAFRFVNVYGEGMHPNVISFYLDHLKQNRERVERGETPRGIHFTDHARDFMAATELAGVLSGVLGVLEGEEKRHSEIVHVGTGHVYTMLEVLKNVAAFVGVDLPELEDHGDQPLKMMALSDYDMLQKQLPGTQPKMTLEEGLRATAEKNRSEVRKAGATEISAMLKTPMILMGRSLTDSWLWLVRNRQIVAKTKHPNTGNDIEYGVRISKDRENVEHFATDLATGKDLEDVILEKSVGPFAANFIWSRSLRPSSFGYQSLEDRRKRFEAPHDPETCSFDAGPLALKNRPEVARITAQDHRIWQVYQNVSPMDERGGYLLIPDLSKPGNLRKQRLTKEDISDLTEMSFSSSGLTIYFEGPMSGASQNHIHAKVYPGTVGLGEGFVAVRDAEGRVLAEQFSKELPGLTLDADAKDSEAFVTRWSAPNVAVLSRALSVVLPALDQAGFPFSVAWSGKSAWLVVREPGKDVLPELPGETWGSYQLINRIFSMESLKNYNALTEAGIRSAMNRTIHSRTETIEFFAKTFEVRRSEMRAGNSLDSKRSFRGTRGHEPGENAEAWMIRDPRTEAEKGLAYQAPLLLKDPRNTDRAWRDFHEMIFEFPKLLEYAAKKKLPVVLVIPEKLDGFGPLAEEAPWIEGARTALAWASAYFRFKELGNVDVRVLQLPVGEVPQATIAIAVKKILSKSVRDEGGGPETQMEARMFRLVDALQIISSQTSKLSLESRAIDAITGMKKSDATPELIRPNLPSIPAGKKRIVVTGAAGFIGINLVKRLLAEGNQVIALDDLITANKDFSSFFQNEPDLYFKEWDVSKPFDIDGPVDQVIHLASLASPPDYYVRPLETLRSGLQGTREMLELARRKGARFLFTSTSEVYGDAKVHPQRETYAGNVSPFKKRSQYDQSKRGAETLMKLYAERYAGEVPDFRIARLFNTYGPFMRLDDGRAVTNFIEKLLTGQPIQIYGNEKITRSFGYVEDTLDGLLKLLRSDKLTSATPIQDRVFNIGNDSEFTLGELAGLVNELGRKHLHRTVPVHITEVKDSSDPARRRPDLTRARTFLDYAPTVPLREGLEKTFLYFLNARSDLKSRSEIREKGYHFYWEFLKGIKQGDVTFAMIKPDGIAHRDKIVQKFQEAGFEVYMSKPIRVDAETVREFYKIHRERPAYEGLIKYMTSGEVIPMLLLHPGGDAAQRFNEKKKAIRKELQETYQLPTQQDFKGHTVQINLFHASDPSDEAQRQPRDGKNQVAFESELVGANLEFVGPISTPTANRSEMRAGIRRVLVVASDDDRREQVAGLIDQWLRQKQKEGRVVKTKTFQEAWGRFQEAVQSQAPFDLIVANVSGADPTEKDFNEKVQKLKPTALLGMSQDGRSTITPTIALKDKDVSRGFTDAMNALDAEIRLIPMSIQASDGTHFEVSSDLWVSVEDDYYNQASGDPDSARIAITRNGGEAFADFTKDGFMHISHDSKGIYNPLVAIGVNEDWQKLYSGIGTSLMSFAFQVSRATTGTPRFFVSSSLADEFYASLGMVAVPGRSDEKKSFWFPLEPEKMFWYGVEFPSIEIKRKLTPDLLIQLPDAYQTSYRAVSEHSGPEGSAIAFLPEDAEKKKAERVLLEDNALEVLKMGHQEASARLRAIKILVPFQSAVERVKSRLLQHRLLNKVLTPEEFNESLARQSQLKEHQEGIFRSVYQGEMDGEALQKVLTEFEAELPKRAEELARARAAVNPGFTAIFKIAEALNPGFDRAVLHQAYLAAPSMKAPEHSTTPDHGSFFSLDVQEDSVLEDLKGLGVPGATISEEGHLGENLAGDDEFLLGKNGWGSARKFRLSVPSRYRAFINLYLRQRELVKAAMAGTQGSDESHVSGTRQARSETRKTQPQVPNAEFGKDRPGIRELEIAPVQSTTKMRRDGAETMVRAIRKNVQPATVFVDAADLGNLSLAQKQEYLFVALSNKAVRIIVYNERGQARDKQLDAFLRSDRVTRTDQDLSRALAVFGKENIPTIHLSKQILPDSGTVRSLGKRVMFFKQRGEKGGTLAVALLWVISGAEKARLAGVSLEKDGFWTVAETLLSGLQKAYESSLVFAIAA